MFSVWEKDAKDESGFVGYCYLDLFPRGAFFCTSLRRMFSYRSSYSVQVLTRRRLATSPRVREGRRLA